MNTKQLKDKILSMAMRGELVEQDPSEESAQILLEKIKEEKAKLIAEKKIKKEKPLAEIEEDEIPYVLPQGWVWTRLGATVEVKGGKRIPKGKTLTKEVTPYKYIRVTDMKNGTVLSEDIHYITEDIYNVISNYTISKDDIYITCAGTIGEVGIIPEEFDGANLTENADKLVFSYGNLEKNYILHLLKADMIKQQINLSLTQVAQPKLAINKITNLLIPLPPLAEQNRIVEKIEALFKEVDKLEESREKLDSLKDKLDKKLLDMAMRGELVEQNPSEESAQILLEKIKEEKAKLIAEKKIKKEKPLAEIEEDEIPYDLPQGWVWTRLGGIVDIRNGFTPLKSNPDFWTDGDVNWLTAADIREQGGEITQDTQQRINSICVTEDRIVPENSVLLCCTASIGLTTITRIPITTNQQFNGLTVKELYKKLADIEYIYQFTRTLKSQLERISTTTTISFVSVKKLGDLLIPLPPLAEQKRIVDKLEKARKLISENL